MFLLLPSFASVVSYIQCALLITSSFFKHPSAALQFYIEAKLATSPIHSVEMIHLNTRDEMHHRWCFVDFKSNFGAAIKIDLKKLKPRNYPAKFQGKLGRLGAICAIDFECGKYVNSYCNSLLT